MRSAPRRGRGAKKGTSDFPRKCGAPRAVLEVPKRVLSVSVKCGSAPRRGRSAPKGTSEPGRDPMSRRRLARARASAAAEEIIELRRQGRVELAEDRVLGGGLGAAALGQVAGGEGITDLGVARVDGCRALQPL